MLDCCAVHAAAAARLADGTEVGVRREGANLYHVSLFRGGGLFRRIGLVDGEQLQGILDGSQADMPSMAR